MQHESDHVSNTKGPGPQGKVEPGDGPQLGLTAVVKGKSSDSRPWSESAEVTSLSSSGAGLFISASCYVGRLISLILQMPQSMRRYDHDKRLYRVWGLVQYCYQAGGEQTGFHVGVALLGRDAPPTYQDDPMRSYRVCGVRKNGLWKIEELDNSFKPRRSVRYWSSIDVTISQLDDDLNSKVIAITNTENISETGAAVFSDLRVAVGDPIRFQSNRPQFSSLSMVRGRRIGNDGRTRIHLGFVENTFPVLELDASFESSDNE